MRPSAGGPLPGPNPGPAPGPPGTGAAGTNPVFPKPVLPAAPGTLPVARPVLPQVADDGGGVLPLPLPEAKFESLPVSKRGCDAGAELLAFIGGEALVPGCAGIPGEANAGDRAAASVYNMVTRMGRSKGRWDLISFSREHSPCRPLRRHLLTWGCRFGDDGMGRLG
jgi:hypothetical protein